MDSPELQGIAVPDGFLQLYDTKQTRFRCRMSSTSPAGVVFSSFADSAAVYRRRFPPCWSSSAPQQMACPQGLMSVLSDPCVDCCGRDPLCRVIRKSESLPTTNLIWGPVIVQASLNRTADLWTIHFPLQRTLLPPLSGLAMGARRIVLPVVRVVPLQLSGDDGRMPVQHLGNRRLSESPQPQMSYPVTFFQRKMPCHRRDSVPKGSALDIALGNSRHSFSGTPIPHITLKGISCISVL